MALSRPNFRTESNADRTQEGSERIAFVLSAQIGKILIIAETLIHTNTCISLTACQQDVRVFFQDFLLGPFLQRRLSLAEQLGWLPNPPLPPQ
jgi:hypothetical protein